MTRKEQRRAGKGAIELIEEAAHLLRLASGGTLAAYYLGTLPFALGFLYFWADMAHSAFAYERCAPAALGLGLLFVWMKTWQAVFARQLRAQIAAEPLPPVTAGWLARVAVVQAVWQPSGFLILPLALIAALPFGWAYAFYQNVTACGGGPDADVKAVYQQARRQTQPWPQQNHLLLSILLLFGLMVWLNVAVGLMQIPILLKTFFGIETMFTRSLGSLLNTTFLATTCAVTYLCLDPLVKAVYVLRCFYGESLQSGEDLKTELKRLSAVPATAAVVLLCLLVAGAPARAAETLAPVKPPASPLPVRVSAPDLDRAIEQVINQREYSWRLPRERRVQDETKKGFFAAFMEGVVDTIGRGFKVLIRWSKVVRDWVADLIDWFKERLGLDKAAERGAHGAGWMISLQVLVFVLLALAASTAAILFWRMWRRRRRREEVAAQPIVPTLDLNDENVVADQLPEDGWLKLARELMERGDLRLALRALYLASLAHLAQREFISVAKFKSNRDYEVELRRRTRALPDLQGAFAENVSIFDRVWYGLHEVSRDVLEHFQANLERIKAC